MSQVVPQALPPVPQVPLRLYGNQALKLIGPPKRKLHMGAESSQGHIPICKGLACLGLADKTGLPVFDVVGCYGNLIMQTYSRYESSNCLVSQEIRLYM